MDIKRREFLQGVGVGGAIGLAGCTDFLSDSSPDVSSDERLSISIDDVDQPPVLERHNIDFDVDVEREQASTENPTQISITIRNIGDTEILLTDKSRPVFDGHKSVNGDSNILLIQPDEWQDSQVESENCWRFSEEIPFFESEYTTSVRPDDEETVKLDLLASHENNGCTPTGEHRFEDHYTLNLPDMSEDQVDEEFEWGFTLTLSREPPLEEEE